MGARDQERRGAAAQVEGGRLPPGIALMAGVGGLHDVAGGGPGVDRHQRAALERAAGVLADEERLTAARILVEHQLPVTGISSPDDRLEAARVFFAEDGPNHVAGQEKELAKVAENVGNCISLRSREGEAVSGGLVIRVRNHRPAVPRAVGLQAGQRAPGNPLQGQPLQGTLARHPGSDRQRRTAKEVPRVEDRVASPTSQPGTRGIST